jgi:hypothetical protein
VLHPLAASPSPFFGFAFLLIMLLSAACLAQDTRPTAVQVDAAYLYNFGKFVTWPSDRSATPDLFQICILGKDPFGAVLDSTVAGASIQGKKVSVRRLANMQEAPACNILFISASQEKYLKIILPTAEHMNLLTVSDIKNFAARGGIIGLITLQDKIRFEVNRTAAERSHLTLSSELLKVAVKVMEGNATGS